MRFSQSHLKAAQIAAYNLSESMPAFDAVLRNGLNDLYVRNQDIRIRVWFKGRTFFEDITSLNLTIELMNILILLVIFGSLFIVEFK